MQYTKTTLPNGLRVITSPMPGLESATVTIWVGVGSRHEQGRLGGISHFLEHMAFKGGKKYKNSKEVAYAIDSIGGVQNAFTGKHLTGYYVKALKTHIETSFDVLSDMLISPSFRDKDVERERGVIIEEIRMYDDNPRSLASRLFDELMFPGHPLGRDIAGTKDTVPFITVEDFRDHLRKHYVPSNLVVTVAGNVDPDKVEKHAQKYFGSLTGKKPALPEKFGGFAKSSKVLVHKKRTEQANIYIGFPGTQLGDEARYVESVMTALLRGGMSSRLFTEVREKRGLAYSVGAGADHFVETGSFALYAGTDPKKASKAIKVMLSVVQKLSSKKHGITKKELGKAKEYMKGHIAMDLEHSESVNQFFGAEELMLGRARTPEEVIAAIDEVTVEQVVAHAKKLFDRKNIFLTVVGPYKSDGEFRKLLG